MNIGFDNSCEELEYRWLSHHMRIMRVTKVALRLANVPYEVPIMIEHIVSSLMYQTNQAISMIETTGTLIVR
jgi:hypothetical protein